MPSGPEEPRESIEPPTQPFPAPVSSAPRAEWKAFAAPDECRPFRKGRIDVLRIGGHIVGRLTLEPGWRWSEHVKPISGTSWCWATHLQYHVSGRLRVRLVDGTEFEAGPGSVSSLPCGHDAWVVGSESVVLVDWCGAANFARRWIPPSTVRPM